METRRTQTLQQLERMQVDDPGIIRLRRFLLAELDSGLPEPAELVGSTVTPELDTIGVSAQGPPICEPVVRTKDGQPSQQRSLPPENEASNVLPSEIQISHEEPVPATLCSTAENKLTPSMDVLSDQEKVLRRCTNQSTHLDSGRTTIHTDSGSFPCHGRSGEHNQPTHPKDTTNDGPTACCPCHQQTSSRSRKASDSHDSPSRGIDMTAYSLFSDLEDLVKVLPPRRSRR